MAATTKNQLGARMAKEMINAGTRAGKRELIRPIVWPAAQRQLDDWYAGTLDAGDLPADLLLSEMSFFDDDALAVLSADRRTTVAGAASELLAQRRGVADSFDALAVLKAPRSGPQGLFELMLRQRITMDVTIAGTLVGWHESTKATTKQPHLQWWVTGDVRMTFAALCTAGLVDDDAACMLLVRLPVVRWMIEEILTTVTLSEATVAEWSRRCDPGDVCNDAALLPDKGAASRVVSACLATPGGVRHSPRALRSGHGELALTSQEWTALLAGREARTLWWWAESVPADVTVDDVLVDVAAARFGVAIAKEIESMKPLTVMFALGTLGYMRKHDSTSRLCAAFQAQAVLSCDDYSALSTTTAPSVGAIVGVCEAICQNLSSPTDIDMALTLVRSGMPAAKAIEATQLVG